MLIRLPDGTRLVIRDIRPDDKRRLRAALTRLSPESNRARFLTERRNFSAAELRYLTELDPTRHEALVAVPLDEPDRIVAVARYVRLPDDPMSAEVAVVVADSLQGQGLGRRLGLLLADRARRNGVLRFTATMLPENVPAHRLLAALSARLETAHLGSVDELVAPLAA